MMKGYDREEALAFILSRINRNAHPELRDQIDGLIAQAIDADMKYMHENGVLDADGVIGARHGRIGHAKRPGVDTHHRAVFVHEGAAGVAAVDGAAHLDHAASARVGQHVLRFIKAHGVAGGDGHVVDRREQVALVRCPV